MRLTYNSRFPVVLSALFLAGSVAAQTTTTPTAPTTTTPCPSTTNPTLVAFSVERTLNPTQISSTLTPTFPQGLLAAVASNAMEIREGMTYNPTNQVLTINLFSVQAGATSPTPIANLTPSQLFGILAIH